jgi:hypothetical protein
MWQWATKGPLSIQQMMHEWIWSRYEVTARGENRSTRKEPWPSATLSTTSPIQTDLIANLGLCGGESFQPTERWNASPSSQLHVMECNENRFITLCNASFRAAIGYVNNITYNNMQCVISIDDTLRRQNSMSTLSTNQLCTQNSKDGFWKKMCRYVEPNSNLLSLYNVTSSTRFALVYPTRLHSVFLKCRGKFDSYSTSIPPILLHDVVLTHRCNFACIPPSSALRQLNFTPTSPYQAQTTSFRQLRYSIRISQRNYETV